MDYGSFALLCFSRGINPQIILACEDFVRKDAQHFPYMWELSNRPPSYDFGCAELRDVLTIGSALELIKENIDMSTDDYDRLSRSLRTIRTKQLIAKPHKSLLRLVLKAFYLAGGRI